MGYYCTVPQCTSLAGKTKNVKFHRFPRDETMADKWNVILKRGKPYTKYSKVCSLHFTQNDYNVTNMGQWKTLSKDAVPSQNLPKLNPDGTVMVIRKSRTLKYKESRKDEPIDKTEKWSPIGMSHVPSAPLPEPALEPDSSLAYRLQTLHAIAAGVSPLSPPPPAAPAPAPAPAAPAPAAPPAPAPKPRKQDAFMQTDPVQDEDEDNNQPNNSYSEASDNSYHSHSEQIAEYPVQYKEPEKPYESKSYDPKSYDSKSYDSKSYDSKSYEPPKDYTKQTDDYIPQTDEEYNKEAEKYALGQKSLNGYDKDQYQKSLDYQKMGQLYSFSDKQEFRSYYPNGYTDSAEILRNQQANLQILQQQHRVTENQNFFTEGIKQEVDLSGEDMYDRSKEISERDAGMYETQRRLAQQRSLELMPPQVKQEPEGCENVMQPQGSPYGYSNGLNGVQGYYEQLSRPGPEMLIAKQNALAAHTQLWQNTMKRPFFYSESPHYNGPPLLHRYEDIPRILQ
ncbi:uncharacterized protein LOC133533065 [Cydia pomonella]|uniref:uncharacterized protein LOC133533065 n=1 Tax=Cydia pomonella TaxID=82600 RepID=UPI002ADDE20A|nr:uncharacterized protein LOC133533065 [Cydia pomonella]